MHTNFWHAKSMKSSQFQRNHNTKKTRSFPSGMRYIYVIFHFENNGNFDRSLSLKGDENFPHETIRSIIVNNNVAFNSTERNIIYPTFSRVTMVSNHFRLFIHTAAKESAIKWNICQNITWNLHSGGENKKKLPIHYLMNEWIVPTETNNE